MWSLDSLYGIPCVQKQAHNSNGVAPQYWQSDARNGPLTPGGCRLTTNHYPLTVAPAARRIATIPSCPRRVAHARGVAQGSSSGRLTGAAREQQLDHVGHVVPGGPRERESSGSHRPWRRSPIPRRAEWPHIPDDAPAAGRGCRARTGRAAGLCAASSAGWGPCRFQATAAASRDR